MKLSLSLAASVVLLGICASGCRTTEANYREAYNKALAGREEATPLDSTIYGKVRREMRSTVLVAGGDTVSLRSIHVNPTPETDGAAASALPAPFGVVAGQFKTLFNARSLCKRLREEGYGEASVVNTAEPYYYVVASWHQSGLDAAQALRKLQAKAPVAMREPLPFVLQIPGKH